MKIPFGKAELTLSEKGLITDIAFDDKTVFPTGRASFLVRGFMQNTPADILQVSLEGRRLTCSFENVQDTVSLLITPKEEYTVFEVEKCPSCFDFLAFGPIATTLDDVVGDVVGVVQGGDAAIGIQALNIKTMSGFPYELASHRLHASGGATSSMTVGSIDYTAAAACATSFGSILQLYGENRDRERVKTVEYAENCIPAPPLENGDAHIEGCRFALFACDRAEALNTIGRLEAAEGLPHPTLDGQWLKTSRKARCSYLIGEFGTENVDKMLSYAQMGGFSCLYHPEPFESWGHFILRREQFPQGDASLKECVEKARALGMRMGLHTLSAFTSTQDPYVTPVPHKGLKAMLPGILESPLGQTQTELTVRALGGVHLGSTLSCIRIEDALIQYADYEISPQDAALAEACGKEESGDTAPLPGTGDTVSPDACAATRTVVLKGCTRGAFGTVASPHPAGSPVQKLIDYPYRTLFPDIRLQDQFSDRLANLFVQTGVSQISFDGLEGCEWTGEGEYAVNRFCMRWYRQLDHLVLNDASRLHHFLWHMNTRMNWGEPWGEEMRTGQVEGRIRNQEFFRKNLFPAMLGWFLVRKANRKFEASTLEDMEWALSEAAGFDAGFSLSAGCDTLDSLGNAAEILEAIRNWDLLRFENRFSDELKELLKKPETEWHLEKEGEHLFRLYPIAITKPLVCDLLEMQPGQPGGSDWTLRNPMEKQNFAFRMKVNGYGYIQDPRFYCKYGMLQFRAVVKGGQYLLFDGKEAYVTDRNYNRLAQVDYSGSCQIDQGDTQLSFGCSFGGDEGPEVQVRIITKAKPYLIRR